ncbi:MAG: hypothetical protein KC503_43100 [Myxococcales bacterium]|nr:hypothetical protein [Myxococcales bacterium]
MGVGEQFLAIFRAPAALAKLPSRATRYLLLYLVAAVALLGVTAWLLILFQHDIRAGIVSYLLPKKAQFAADLLIGFLVKSQAKSVLINATASATLVLVSLLLFPIKERLSASFEQDAELTGKPKDEFPTWFQALEEIKMIVIYLTGFMVIFWIGYHPSPARKMAATVLSYAFLFFQIAVDFISPTLQRHRMRYSRIIVTLFKNPLAMFGFGAFFAAPIVVAGLIVKGSTTMTMTTAVLLLFGANVISIVWAAVGGTWLAAQLLEPTEQTGMIPLPARLVGWIVIVGFFSYSGYVFYSLGMLVHHKSQILKLDYGVDLDSFAFELPKASGGKKGGGWLDKIKGIASSVVDSVTSGQVKVGASIVVNIKNPTKYDVELEKNRIEFKHGNTVVAKTMITPIKIPAGADMSKRLSFNLAINPRSLVKGRDLFKNKWSITIYFKLTDSFDFPIYLLSPDGATGKPKKKK